MNIEQEINFYFFPQETYLKSIGLLLQQIHIQALQNDDRLDQIPNLEKKEAMIKPMPNLSNRIFILCSSLQQMQQYDEGLWVYSQLSFLPHSTENDIKLEQQPVVLGTDPKSIQKAGDGFKILLLMPEALQNLRSEFYGIAGHIQKIIVPLTVEKPTSEENMKQSAANYLKFVANSNPQLNVNIVYKNPETNHWVKKAMN